MKMKTQLPVPDKIDTDELREVAKCVFRATNDETIQDLAYRLNDAANLIDELREFAIWMTGCGYDFCQHEYFCKKRDTLLKVE